MKTIFLTIFEGTEGKNILRTDILPTLLESNSRLIILVKNQERAEYHKKEFNDPRFIYEIVEPPEITGFDKFFSNLKFTLLRTSTTDLRRKITHTSRWRNFLNRLLARPFFIRLARILDFQLVKNNIFTTLFKKYNPDLIFMANLFDDLEISLLREAKRRKVKTVALINSWDRLTARCVLRLLADRFMVFNSKLKNDLIKYHLVKKENIFISGIPQYDRYFNFKPSSREKFFKKVGLPSDHKLIIYAPVGASFADYSDWATIDLLYELNDLRYLGEKTSILVRFPPNDFIDKAELEKRPWLKYDYPGVRFSKKRGVDWDMTFSELGHLDESLYYADLIISYFSSISIDAAIFDKPVINIGFNPNKNNTNALRYYDMEHYAGALRSGGIKLVKNSDELITSINDYLGDPSLDREGRKRLVREQCEFMDGKSSQRIGKFILNYVENNI